MPRYAVMRVRYDLHVGHATYEEITPHGHHVGVDERGVEAADAGHAFRIAVVEAGQFNSSEFAVFPLEGSVKIGVEINLTATEENGRRVAAAA
jgi:hypothetical protein